MENYWQLYESNDIYGIKPIDTSKGVLNNWQDLDISKKSDKQKDSGDVIDYSTKRQK